MLLTTESQEVQRPAAKAKVVCSVKSMVVSGSPKKVVGII